VAALGVDEFTDATGKKHDWRAELVAELAKRQQSNGSWLNETPRWLEGNPNLVTGYTLLALSYAKPKP
jgi:squalene-hopene/tetraprenyl-beta-curcumene cyclase